MRDGATDCCVRILIEQYSWTGAACRLQAALLSMISAVS